MSITYTFTVMANAKGTFTIFPASIVASGKPITSNTLKIKVLPADKSGSGSSSSRSSRSQSSGTKVSASDIIIVGSVNTKECYVPINLVANKRNVIDTRGTDHQSLWEYVVFSTGQPSFQSNDDQRGGKDVIKAS